MYAIVAMSGMGFLLCGAAMGEAFGVPKIAGDYVNIYQPAGDAFQGPSDEPLEAGIYYEDWVANDHCFVRDEGGRWHLFGITHPESGLENVHAGEYQSFHALAPEGSLSQTLSVGAWKDQPKVLPPKERPGERPENHAPSIVQVEGVYHMIYGPTPLRHATSNDLYDWKPQGPLKNSIVSRDPCLFFWENEWHVLTCGVFDVRMAVLRNFSNCEEPRVIFEHASGVDPESPTLIQRDGTFYLFVCDWNGVWDKKDLWGAYQHLTRVYRSDDPFHFETENEIAQIDAHAPEIIRGEKENEWFISSAEWPYRGVSIAPLVWTHHP
ncbi:MAG: hypothetical protein KC917_14520 [Candidatus Omnitrophica bacterium]|nr:hypothetical protein [Candidatus Omnitrophota bacterium]